MSDVIQRLALDHTDQTALDLLITELQRNQLSPKLNSILQEFERLILKHEILKNEHKLLTEQNEELRRKLHQWSNDTKESIVQDIEKLIDEERFNVHTMTSEKLSEMVDIFLENNREGEADFSEDYYVHNLIDYDIWLLEIKERFK
jgi:hypothetical protein